MSMRHQQIFPFIADTTFFHNFVLDYEGIFCVSHRNSSKQTDKLINFL
jgi:hypothetical protein